MMCNVLATRRAAIRFAVAFAVCFPCVAVGIQTQAIFDNKEARVQKQQQLLNATTPAKQELIIDISRDAMFLADGGSTDPALRDAEAALHGKSGTASQVSGGKEKDEEDQKTGHSHPLAMLALATLIVCAAVPVLLSQGLVPFVAVLAYIVCLVAVKLCVKEVFKSGYPYPYATTAFHMLVTAVVASCIEPPGRSGAKSTFFVSVVKAASLALSNMALVFGTAAFVSILSACTPATTFAVEMFRFGTTTSSKLLSIMAVCAGAALCVKGELSFSLLAVVLTLGACLCRSLKTVWSHDLMQVDMSPYRLAAWTAIWSFLFTAIATAVMEGTTPFRAFPVTSTHTKIVFFAGAVLATALNLLMCFVLKYLGPLQQNIFGQLELVAVVTLAMAWLHETVTTMQWTGVVLIGLGCVLSKIDSLAAVKSLARGSIAWRPTLPKAP